MGEREDPRASHPDEQRHLSEVKKTRENGQEGKASLPDQSLPSTATILV